MLPDYPKIKEKAIKEINSYMRELISRESLFSLIREEKCFEGDKMITEDKSGEVDSSPFKEITVDQVVVRQDVITKGIYAFIESINEVAERFKKEKAMLMFSKLNEVAEKNGMTVDGKHKPFSFDLFIEMLDKMQIDFDDNGEARMPTVVVNPSLAAVIKEKLPQWDSNIEYKKRMDDLKKRKKEEWDVRESSRKLVD